MYNINRLSLSHPSFCTFLSEMIVTKMTFFTPMQMKLIITKRISTKTCLESEGLWDSKLPVYNAYFILIKNINYEKIN